MAFRKWVSFKAVYIDLSKIFYVRGQQVETSGQVFVLVEGQRGQSMDIFVFFGAIVLSQVFFWLAKLYLGELSGIQKLLVLGVLSLFVTIAIDPSEFFLISILNAGAVMAYQVCIHQFWIQSCKSESKLKSDIASDYFSKGASPDP
jgi:hypothetical protein